MAYHPINYGWVIAELVHRVDGRPFNRLSRRSSPRPWGWRTPTWVTKGLEDRVSHAEMEADADPNDYSTTFSLPVAVHAWSLGLAGWPLRAIWPGSTP